MKGKKQKKSEGTRKDENEKKLNKAGKKDQKIKAAEEAPTDYVHVRARRGQATDSHSLAERVLLITIHFLRKWVLDFDSLIYSV